MTSKEKNHHIDSFDEITPYQQELQAKLPSSWYVVWILGILAIGTGFEVDAFAPAINQMSSVFQVTAAHIQATIPYYLIGLGFGQLFWGPFMDRFGRLPLIYLCTIFAVILNTITTLTTDYYILVAFRVMAGLVFAGISTVPSIILKDIYSPRKFVVLNSWLVTIFLFSPALAPLMGGYIYLFLDWKWIFHAVSLIVLISGIFLVRKLPETLDPSKRQSFRISNIVTNYAKILSSSKSLLLIGVNVIFSIIIFVPVTLLPGVLINDHGVKPQDFGYFIAVIIFVVILGIQTNSRLVHKGKNLVKIWVASAWIQLAASGVNYFIAFYNHGSLLSPYTIIGALVINVYFHGFQIGNTYALYLTNYQKMMGTASSLLTAIRMVIPGFLIGYFAHLPSYNGATLLVINGLMYILTLVCCLSYIALSKVKVDS